MYGTTSDYATSPPFPQIPLVSTSVVWTTERPTLSRPVLYRANSLQFAEGGTGVVRVSAARGTCPAALGAAVLPGPSGR